MGRAIRIIDRDSTEEQEAAIDCALRAAIEQMPGLKGAKPRKSESGNVFAEIDNASVNLGHISDLIDELEKTVNHRS